VYSFRIKDLRQVGFRPSANPGNAGTFGRLAAHNLYLRVLFFQEHGVAHDTAGRTHRADKTVDLSRCVTPYFRTGTLVMTQVLISIGKLVQQEIAILCSFFLSIVPAYLDRLQ